MKKVLIAGLLLAAPYTVVSADECQVDAQQVSAHYQVSLLKEGKASWSDEMFLWRDARRVAQQYKHKHITNMWEKTSNEQLHLIRFFDEYQRAIEYQPDEVQVSDLQAYWQQMNQLITNAELSDMKKVATAGQGCELTESYLLDKEGLRIELEWMPELKLVKSFKQTADHVVKTWSLEELIKDKHEIDTAFSSRLAYQTTDYADIGDSESDPFLAKMIHLGYLGHEASGFYDDQGHQLSGEHYH